MKKDTVLSRNKQEGVDQTSTCNGIAIRPKFRVEYLMTFIHNLEIYWYVQYSQNQSLCGSLDRL